MQNPTNTVPMITVPVYATLALMLVGAGLTGCGDGGGGNDDAGVAEGDGLPPDRHVGTGSETVADGGGPEPWGPNGAPDAGGDGPATCAEGERRCGPAGTPQTCTEGRFSDRPLCEAGLACVGGECRVAACAPGEKRCIDDRTAEVCQPDGSEFGPPVMCSDNTTCVNGTCALPECFPGVMFLVDRSTSMGRHWQAVQRSIDAVISANENIRFGLSVFPSSAGFLYGCSSGEMNEWPHVPIQRDAAGPIGNWFGTNGVAGATPLLGALQYMAEHSGTIWNREEAGYLVVISDGLDTCTSRCEDDEEEEQDPHCTAELIQPAVRQLLADGVKTYVIGYNFTEDPIQLDTIAAEGGTGLDGFVFAGSEASLTSVFEQFVRDIKFCR
jgi:hypothetical protein